MKTNVFKHVGDFGFSTFHVGYMDSVSFLLDWLYTESCRMHIFGKLFHIICDDEGLS